MPRPFRAGRNASLPLGKRKYSSIPVVATLMKMCHTACMIITVTAKLKLFTTPEQFQALRATQLAYRDALTYVRRYAFAHGKLSNQVGLQEGAYLDIRARFGLPAQMACSAPA